MNQFEKLAIEHGIESYALVCGEEVKTWFVLVGEANGEHVLTT